MGAQAGRIAGKCRDRVVCSREIQQPISRGTGARPAGRTSEGGLATVSNEEAQERDGFEDYFGKLNFIFMKVCWLFLARSEQREARRLGSALAREREGVFLMRSHLIAGVWGFLLNRWRSPANGMMRNAPPCGGTEPAPRESVGECGMAGDLIGGAKPPSQRNIALSFFVR